MFIPNVMAKLSRRLGTDVYGNPKFSKPVPIRIGVTDLVELSKATSVRTDSSASKGSAMEETIKARILTPGNLRLDQGDEVVFMDFHLSVQSIFPRYNVAGKLDHWQVDCRILGNQDFKMATP